MFGDDLDRCCPVQNRNCSHDSGFGCVVEANNTRVQAQGPENGTVVWLHGPEKSTGVTVQNPEKGTGVRLRGIENGTSVVCLADLVLHI